MFQRLGSEWDWCGQRYCQFLVPLKASLKKNSTETLLVLEPLAALRGDSEAHQPWGWVCFTSGFLSGRNTARTSVLARLPAGGFPESSVFSHHCDTLNLYSALWITSVCPHNNPAESQSRPSQPYGSQDYTQVYSPYFPYCNGKPLKFWQFDIF